MYHWLWRAPFRLLDACSFPCAGGVTSTTGCTTGSTPAGQHTTRPGSSPLPVVHIRYRKHFQDNNFRSRQPSTRVTCCGCRPKSRESYQERDAEDDRRRRDRTLDRGRSIEEERRRRGLERERERQEERRRRDDRERGSGRHSYDYRRRSRSRERSRSRRLPSRARSRSRGAEDHRRDRSREQRTRRCALLLPSLGRCVCMGDMYGGMMCNPCPCLQQDVLLTPPIAGWGHRTSCRLVHCSRNILSASMMILPHWFSAWVAPAAACT